MTYTNFITYGGLLTEILDKLRGLPSQKFTRMLSYSNLTKHYVYYVDVGDFGISLEKKKKEHCTIRGCEYKDRHVLKISKPGGSLVFDDEGIDTNDPTIVSLRALFHDVESYFDKKPADKNRRLLGELLEKLK